MGNRTRTGDGARWQKFLWHARSPEFDHLRYKHTLKDNDITSTCTTTTGILESKATLQEGNRALKMAGSEARARKIQIESQKILYQNGKKVFKERWEHVQREGLPKG